MALHSTRRLIGLAFLTTVFNSAFAGLDTGPLGTGALFFTKAAGPKHAYALHGPGLQAEFEVGQVKIASAAGLVEVRFPGANPASQLRAIEPSPGPKSPAALPAFSGVKYHDLYPGIDMIYRVAGPHVKSEFIVAPGADPGAIRIAYGGARTPVVDASGALVLRTSKGEMRESGLKVYQQAAKSYLPVQGCFKVFLENGTVGFELGSYDRTLPLIIDPTISFSTYLGGSGFDAATGVAVDSAGNIYVTGWTASADLPVRSGAIQGTNRGGVDAFVAKFDRTGSTLLYCTYLGGSGDDRGLSIAVDAAGSAYIAGATSSPNFPVTGQSRFRGGRKAFVAKLSPAGDRLIYSTFLGGSGYDVANGIAVDSAGNAFVAGATYSTDFPTVWPIQSASGGQQDAFVAELDSTGARLLFSTYLGGMGNDGANAIALDGAGAVYVAGDTDSPNFRTLNALQAASGGGQDAFVVKLNPATGSLIYSTYLGGSGGIAGLPESATAIDVDSSGNAYVAGVTSSPNFKVSGAYQSTLKGLLNAFLVKLAPAGNALVYGTYLGGASVEMANAVRVDPSGKACVAGYTGSSNFPLANPTQQSNAGAYDAFVSCFTPAGNTLDFSTYLGGAASDAANAIALTGTSIYLAGQTTSQDFPLRNPKQNWNGGSYGAFISQVQSVTIHPPSLVSVTPNSGTGASQTFTFQFADAGADFAAFQVLINGTFSDYRACHVLYVAASNSLYLLNDAGTSYSAPITPGSTGVLQNNQCGVDGRGSSITGLGTTAVALRIALNFSASFTGTKWLPLYASDCTGQNSGWLTPASWTVPSANHPPSVASASPNSGSGASQTFTLQLADPGADIYAAQLLINGTFSDYHACHILYIAASNSLYLLNDVGTTYSAPMTPGATAVLQNSQCRIDGAVSAVTGTTTATVMLKLALSFTSTFAGTKNISTFISDRAGQNSDWSTPATWTVPTAASHPPTIASVTPHSGTGMTQTFTFELADSGADTSAAQVLINSGLTDHYACHILYLAAANSLYLLNDAGTSYSTPVMPGSTGTLQNSQCQLDGRTSSVAGLGTTKLTLTIALTFNASFAGAKTLYAYVSDRAGQNSDWVAPATWSVSGVTHAPSISSVIRNFGNRIGTDLYVRIAPARTQIAGVWLLDRPPTM